MQLSKNHISISNRELVLFLHLSHFSHQLPSYHLYSYLWRLIRLWLVKPEWITCPYSPQTATYSSALSCLINVSHF